MSAQQIPISEEIEVQYKKPVESIALQQQQSIVLQAVQRGAGIEEIRALMQLEREYKQDKAREAFVDAMTKFKYNSIVVVRDKVNKQYDSKYVSLGNLVNTVTPFLSQCGLSVRWDIDQTNGIKVCCIVTHSLGHSEQVAMTVPADSSGAKNPIQQIKSAITYAKACTFESICGLASTDANIDDDGNGSTYKMDNLQEQIDWIVNCTTIDELQRIYTSALKKAKEAKDTGAMKAIVAAKDKRKAELL